MMIQALAINKATAQRLDPSIVRVGKDVVELVTSGMYLSPITIYREYVQNSADSIEQGVEDGLIEPGSGSIAIELDHGARSVRIIDNGIGIRTKDAPSILLAIGGSTKRGTGARGFRGIGRLSGIAYCKGLRFRTRAAGEDVISVVEWDCKRLRQRLSDGSSEGDLQSAIANSVTFTQQAVSEEDAEHFFEVTMMDVARHRGDILLNESTIREYLAQVAPIDFRASFSFASEIKAKLLEYGVKVGIVDLTLQGQAILRPYADHTMFAGNLFELKLEKIEFLTFANVDGEVAAIGWVAHHQYARSIPPSLGIGRLRARIGDVQIGDGGVFDEAFKETRFNGWCVGEIHVLDRRIQPNARRDNFELNHHTYNILAQLGPKALELAHRCRDSSVSRNIVLTIENLEQEVHRVAGGRVSVSNAEMSRLRASTTRCRLRLKSVIELERDRCLFLLDGIDKSLADLDVDDDRSVVGIREVTSLVRSIVSNREQAARLIEAMQSLCPTIHNNHPSIDDEAHTPLSDESA